MLCSFSALLAMLSFGSPSAASFQPEQAEIREGERVRPSEFRGDLRNLPQSVSSKQRETFKRRPREHDLALPTLKQFLSGTQGATATSTSTQSVQGPS